jgi:sialic acid synthase SpsE
VLAMGRPSFGGGQSEKTSKSHRRSLFVVKDLKAGETLSRENVRSIRPGGGLPIAEFENIIGLKVAQDTPRGTPVTWDLFRE